MIAIFIYEIVYIELLYELCIKHITGPFFNVNLDLRGMMIHVCHVVRASNKTWSMCEC